MAFTDIFKTRKATKLHQHAWQTIWDRVKTPPTGDATTREVHAVFVGTLLYATRYQAALAVGMEDTIAKTAALEIVYQANFDDRMRDRVLSIFSANPANRSADYAATLNTLVATIVDRAKTRGASPEEESVESRLETIAALMPVLAERLAAEG